MAPGPLGKAPGPINGLTAFDGGQPVGELIFHGIGKTQVELFIGGPPVTALFSATRRPHISAGSSPPTTA